MVFDKNTLLHLKNVFCTFYANRDLVEFCLFFPFQHCTQIVIGTRIAVAELRKSSTFRVATGTSGRGGGEIEKSSDQKRNRNGYTTITLTYAFPSISYGPSPRLLQLLWFGIIEKKIRSHTIAYLTTLTMYDDARHR